MTARGEMVKFRREKAGRYVFVYRGQCGDITGFIQKAMNPGRRLAAGRGAPGLFDFDGKQFICRQYLHGGWLRGVTKGTFLGEKRASDELAITAYLEENGFPVVEALGYISRKGIIANDLFFVSRFVNDARDLVEHFRMSDGRTRLRIARKLGIYFVMLGELGVYHPDLHLRNVLVDPSGHLVFLDFDKACRKKVVPDDYEKMFWRLDRYVRKYSELFGDPVNDKERLIFLRTFERLYGQKIILRMQENRGNKERSARLGWLIDRFLYSRRKD